MLHAYAQTVIRLAVDPRPLCMSQQLCALYDHFLILLALDLRRGDVDPEHTHPLIHTGSDHAVRRKGVSVDKIINWRNDAMRASSPNANCFESLVINSVGVI